MYELVSKSDFRTAFHSMGRGDNFSYEALGALFDYMEDAEISENGYELDVVALCCEFSEDSIENVLEQYSLKSLEELKDNTVVVWHDEEKVLYAQY